MDARVKRSVDHLNEVWNTRARQDAQYYIKCDLDDQSSESFWSSGEEDVEQFVDPWLDRLPGTGRALDIGCGIGRLTQALGSRFEEVVGVDISDEMIGRARSAVPEAPANVGYEHVDGSGRLPFPDQSFDFIFSYIVFQHLPRLDLVENYLRESRRVLRDGGLARIQVNSRRRPFSQRLKVRVARSEKVPLIHRKLVVRLDPHDFMGVVLSRKQCVGIGERVGLALIEAAPIPSQYTWLTLRRDQSST